MNASDVIANCPYRIPRHTEAGCCSWDTFIESFSDCWLRWFQGPPTPHQWSMARQDWKAGNTGFEAAHNAQRRMKEANTPAARQERESRSIANSLIAVTKGAPVKVFHRASKVSPTGAVSALCFARPRAIDLTKAMWTIRDEAVTCPKCIASLRTRLLRHSEGKE